MLTLKFGEASYEFDLDDQLASLTGTESMMVEDFLGGWGKFRDPANLTRSTVVMVWLAQRSAGPPQTLDQILSTPGLVFGDLVDVDGDTDEPEDPRTDPGRPLHDANGSPALNDGNGDAATTLATSDSSGLQESPVSTG